MIVFVPEGSKLRYTSGPLEISGRLDVGIKIDESGYKNHVPPVRRFIHKPVIH
ncbi:hypothetical protein ACFTAO_42575 [Paenibacillus rhizoplanae]